MSDSTANWPVITDFYLTTFCHGKNPTLTTAVLSPRPHCRLALPRSPPKPISDDTVRSLMMAINKWKLGCKWAFLLLACYVPNVAKRSTWEQYNTLRTDDRPMTDLAFWKISNGHFSATDRLIHFMFGSTVGFSRSADRMVLLRFWSYGRVFGDGGSNGSTSGCTKSKIWPPSILENSSDHISGTGYPIYFHEL